MIISIKAKLKELEIRKSDASPKIKEIEEKREEKLAEVNKKYDHMIDDVSTEVTEFEKGIMNDIIDSFVNIIMDEFDAKRSTSEYTLTDQFRSFRDEMSEISIFPKELIDRMDKVIEGDPIENIAYDIEKIEGKYK
jgi:hypothetical protein